MFDSHAHYSHFKFEQSFRFLSYTGGAYHIVEGDRNEIFDEMKSSGIEGFIEPAIGIDSNYKILDLYRDNKGFMYPAVGVHPTRTFLAEWKRRGELDTLACEEGVVAIGETGLDYHYPRLQQHRRCQKRWFRYQIDLAFRNGLPLTLHIRKAYPAAVKILNKNRNKIVGGVVHCFCGTPKEAEQYLNLGLYFGIGGALLHNDDNSRGLKEAVKTIPLERILLETDSPYVLPDTSDDGVKTSRKTRNTSTVILAVAEEIAKIKGIDVSAVLEETDKNTKEVFGIT